MSLAKTRAAPSVADPFYPTVHCDSTLLEDCNWGYMQGIIRLRYETLYLAKNW